MTTSYDVQVDPGKIKEAASLFEFVGGNSADAMRVAINKTTPKVRTASSRAIREQVRLQASYVSQRLSIVKATRRTLNGRIRALSRGLLLSRFSTDPVIASEKVGWFRPPLVPAQGIRVKVKPSGGARLVTGDAETRGNKPFYLVINKGANVAIAARLNNPGPRGGQLKVFSGPSLSQVFNTVRDQVTPSAADIFEGELLDAMRYLLVKKYPPEPTA
jgi:hypothetical protein